MSFRLRGDSYPGIDAQASKNYDRGRNAQSELNNTVNRANRQYIEALNVDGVPFLHWSKAMQGYRCTCRGVREDQNNLPSSDTIDGSWSPDPSDEDFFQVRGVKPVDDRVRAEGAYKVDDGLNNGPTLGLKSTPENTSTDLLTEFVNSEEMIDLLDPNRSVNSSMVDSTVPVIGPETRCGICLGTGLTEGYILSNGKRLVLEASGQYAFTINNMEQNRKKFPARFESGIPAGGYVEWIVTLPTYFHRALSVVVRDNIDAARNVQVMYAFAEDNDSKFKPLNVEALNARNGLATRLRIRVSPIDALDPEIGVGFTHVELNFVFTEWRKMQMPQLSDQLNRAVFDSISNISVILPPTIQQLHMEDFIYDAKYDRIWKVVESTDSLTADRRVTGWNAGLRGLMEYEVGHVLRAFRDPTLNLAFGRLEGAENRTFAKSDSINYSATYETAREKVRELILSLNLGPQAGEFTFDTEPVSLGAGIVNLHTSSATYIEATVNYIKSTYPNCKMLWLSPAWFGADLRPAFTQPKPRVKTASTPNASHDWVCSGVDRASASVVSSFNASPAYDGTPNDASLVRAIKYLKSRGFRVGLRPTLLMDIAEGNSLPIPNSVSNGQTPYPYAADIEPNTTTYAADIATFFGAADAIDFEWDDDIDSIVYSGADVWTYRRFILHYATLARHAGGVDAFLVGTHLTGLTKYTQTVAALELLLEDIRTYVLTCATSYEASMFEYGARFNGNAVEWPLDTLWMNTYCSYIALKFDVPMADWRDTAPNADGAYFLSPYEIAYLQSNIEGGEFGAFKYDDNTARTNQTRNAHSNDWVHFPKRIKSAWMNEHPRRNSGGAFLANTSWVPYSKSFAFTSISVPAILNGMNDLSKDGSKFHPDDYPPFALSYRDDSVTQCALYAFVSYWTEKANNPVGGDNPRRAVRVPLTTPGMLDITKIQMTSVPADHINPWHLLNGRL